MSELTDLETLKESQKRLCHDLVKIADAMEGLEPYERGSLSREYKSTYKELKEVEKEIEELDPKPKPKQEPKPEHHSPLGVCSQCKQKKEIWSTINGSNYCSQDCERLARYKPDMTDKTWEPNTSIDAIDCKNGTLIRLETPDGFYRDFSGYAAIIVYYRGLFCAPDQKYSYRSLDKAKADWELWKKKKGYISWNDKRLNPDIGKKPKKAKDEIDYTGCWTKA